MKDELQRHKTSDKVKWVLTLIGFILVGVLLAGLFLQVFGSGRAKPSEWFKKADKPQAEQTTLETDSNEIESAKAFIIRT